MGLLRSLRDSISHAVDSLFSETEPKRIGIYGPPNAGKCLAANERILLADGTRKSIESVFDSVVDNEPNLTDVSTEPHENWFECKTTNIQVPAISDDQTVNTRRVSHVFKQYYTGPMYEIETEDQRSVTVSPTHPFITKGSPSIQFVPAAKVTKGLPVASLDLSAYSPPVTPGIATDGGTTALTVPPGKPQQHITWDRITEITKVDYAGWIYDLTVTDDHTFPTDDGLFVHNTTLANRITRDWTGDAVGPESKIPHETRRARRKENVVIERNGKTVTIDVVDTPGVTTKVDYQEFMDFDMEKEDAIRRSREATEGVAEAMHWLREDVDGVLYVLDSSKDPFTQVNTMLIGIIESRDLPVLIFANKIDLESSSVKSIQDAFPQHETVPLSALKGDNMDEVYDKIAEYFG